MVLPFWASSHATTVCGIFFSLIFFTCADFYNLIISHLLSVSWTGFFLVGGGVRNTVLTLSEDSDSLYARKNVTGWARWSHQCSFLFGTTCRFGWNVAWGVGVQLEGITSKLNWPTYPQKAYKLMGGIHKCMHDSLNVGKQRCECKSFNER